MKHKLIFQYFEGCPNARETLNNLQDIMQSDEFALELEIVEVPGPELAKELNFQGSPSVLIDNVDLYTEEIPSSYTYSCRIFTIDGQQSGVLSAEYMREKLIKLGVAPSNQA